MNVILKAISRSMDLQVRLTIGAWMLLALVTGSASAAAPGALDLSFGTLGTAIFGPDSEFRQSRNIAVQADGKVLVSGHVRRCPGPTCSSDFLLVRYNVNGTLDSSFGTNGVVITDHFGQDEAAFAMGVQTDGKIVLAGGLYDISTAPNFTGFKIFRYTSDGTLDASFGNAGRAYESFNNLGGTPETMVIQSDGKIVVAGTDDTMLYVLRLETNGTLDASFGTNGTLTTTAYDIGSTRLAQDGNGKLVIAGNSAPAGTIKLLRLTANGTPDATFGSGGVVTSTFSVGFHPAIAICPDGKIIVSGATAYNVDTPLPPLWRFNEDGSVDTGFAPNHGPDNPTSCKRCTQKVRKVLLLPDGKFYLAGSFKADNWMQFSISRYFENGTIDKSFAYNGTALPRHSTAFGSNNLMTGSRIPDAALTPDGKIVITGDANDGNKFYTTRIRTTVTASSVRGDFDGDGKTDAAVFRPSNSYWYVLNSSDGSFLTTFFGLGSDILVPADYNYDLKTDYSVFRPSNNNWYMLPAPMIGQGVFGQTGDIRMPEDFDGDGFADEFAFRPNGTWTIRYSGQAVRTAGNPDLFYAWGVGTDVPVPADYDGDGRADIAVFRPSDGIWYISRSSDGGVTYVQFGFGTDKTLPGDYDGDGKADVAVFRDGIWYIWRSSDGVPVGYSWGYATDKPVPGDYDGDGKFDIAVFRPSDGIWYILKSSDGGFMGKYWGLPDDRPIPNAFVR